MKNKPKIIALVGPTASGKSACGIEIAKAFNGEVICVDSRTVYRGMDIGTAKPSKEVRSSELGVLSQLRPAKYDFQLRTLNPEQVPHWGLDLVDPDEEYTVTMFQAYAQKKIEEIVKRGRLPILVGGTALWMDAVIDNLSFPEVAPDLSLRAELEERETEDLAREYLQLDPEGEVFIDLQNKRRLIRAIEVCRLTGKSFSELRKKGEELYDAQWLGISVDQAVLYERIDSRVEQMIAEGLIDEVRKLMNQFGVQVPSMSGIGYREICEFFCGAVSLKTGEKMKLAEAIENIKTNTRRFAKRQMTWFKRREEIVWVRNVEEAMEEVGSWK